MSFDQTIVLLTLAGTLVLFVTDALRYDMVAVLGVLVLGATGTLSPGDAFAGFSDPAVVLVAAMYVFAAAVSRTGATDFLCERLLGEGTSGEARLALRLTLVAGILSSVLSNAAVVATLIPVVGAISRRVAIPISRLLIPMAYGSLLGGLLSVIGTSKNIAVNGLVERAGAEPLALFEFTHYGFLLLVAGSLYFLWPGRQLLPRKRLQETLTDHYQVPKFVTEVLVDPGSTLINRAVGETDLFERHGVTLLGLVRASGEATVLAPGPYNRIRNDDVLILQGEPDAIMEVRKELDLPERPQVKVGDTLLSSADVRLVEAVVPAGSPLAESTLAQADFRATTNLNVLAISKHGSVQPTKIAHTTLDVGDALLIQGHAPDLERVRNQRLLIVLDEVKSAKIGRMTWVTLALLAAVLLSAALGFPLSVAALTGAVALVLFRIVRPEEVRTVMDWPVLILIGGMLALGKAFDRHGLDDEVAHWMTSLGEAGLSPHAAVFVLLIGTNLLTQLVSHVAAAVILTPVALSVATEMGVSDRPFLMAVLTGASMSFMSPVAHQANAMVMGPGDYRYRHFLRVGTPLTVVLLLLAWVLLPICFPF